MASVRSIDDALNITLNTNGRVLRNLIHGADTVMSHILHFYHLAAADYVDISALGSPWDDGSGGPAFGTTTSTACALVSLTTKVEILGNYTGGRITNELVESYVLALNMRKEAHTMGAIFSGRQPTSNAIVPGGVTTIFNDADIANFKTRLNGIRNFINRYYIPDVVFVATRTSVNWTNYWLVGTNPGTLLSYGEYPYVGDPFPDVASSNMLLQRGVATYVDDINNPSVTTFDTNKIKEYVNHSFYSSADGLHPSVGVTTPLKDAPLTTAMAGTTRYSWLKAPRYDGKAAEVGPLARMVVTALGSGLQTAYQTDSVALTLSGTLGNSYTAYDLVTFTLGQATAVTGITLGVPHLFSPLGRHAARALECKFVADAMYSWLDELTTNNLTTDVAQNPYDTYTTSIRTGSGYVYKAIPKATVMGEGLAEAPRGALGHWITIQNKKIGNYQCVVPSTWNACPQGGPSTGDPNTPGPAESVLTGLNVGTGTNDAILNIARMMHPYDFCIACAVHVVTPEGKDIAKFEMGLDGKIKKL